MNDGSFILVAARIQFLCQKSTWPQRN